MFLCMRTTIDIDDNLLREAKKRAAETGRTLRHLIEDTLRERFARELAQKGLPFHLRWSVVEGSLKPGIDLSDRASLMDLMDRSS